MWEETSLLPHPASANWPCVPDRYLRQVWEGCVRCQPGLPGHGEPLPHKLLHLLLLWWVKALLESKSCSSFGPCVYVGSETNLHVKAPLRFELTLVELILLYRREMKSKISYLMFFVRCLKLQKKNNNLIIRIFFIIINIKRWSTCMEMDILYLSWYIF